MFRLRKNNPSLNTSNQAQSAIEYLLLLSVVTAFVLVAFNGDYLGRVHNAANLYFDRVTVGIYGNSAACGDKFCAPGVENYVKCPTDCPTPPPPPADIDDCVPQQICSGTCGVEISLPKIVNGGTYGPKTCPSGCTGQFKVSCSKQLVSGLQSCLGTGGCKGGVCDNNGTCDVGEHIGSCPGDCIIPAPNPLGCPGGPRLLGNCPTPVDINALDNGMTQYIGSCPSGCVMTGTAAGQITVDCNNTTVSITGRCVPSIWPSPSAAVCPSGSCEAWEDINSCPDDCDISPSGPNKCGKLWVRIGLCPAGVEIPEMNYGQTIASNCPFGCREIQGRSFNVLCTSGGATVFQPSGVLCEPF